MTSETPTALHGLPATSGRRADADCGSPVPVTCENATPAFSTTSPPSIIRVLPPPPSARLHASSRNRPLPSSDSSAAQMESWSPSRYALTGEESGVILGSLRARDMDHGP